MIDMDRILEYQGQRWPFQGPPPEVGSVLAGFIVRSVTDTTVYLKLPETPEESLAFAAWERERQRR